MTRRPALIRRPKRPRALSEGIAQAIEDAIMSGQLGARQRLIELDISRVHGVSRAPVREALQMLERDGLVVRTARGFEVAGVSAEEVSDIFQILAHLEDLYTQLATPHITKVGQRALRSVLVKMKAAVRSGDVAGYYKLNIAFHAIIRSACPNKPLIMLLESLGKKTLRLRRLAMSISGRMPVSLEEHQRLAAAIEAGDAVAAGHFARESAVQAYGTLADFLTHHVLE